MIISIKELMSDPIYRAYMKKAPAPDAHNPNPAWQLWVNPEGNRWLTATYQEYRDGWPMFVTQFKQGREVTLVSRRTFYAPPGEWRTVKVRLDRPRVNQTTGKVTTHRIEQRWRQTFKWDLLDPRAEWCGRCRRPVQFRPLFETHHALKRFPVVSDEDNMRCPICGIRRTAQPHLDQMVRL